MIDTQKRRAMNSQGFTILELLIATVVFSVILMTVTVVLVQIGRLYFKGQITNRTQETARQVADEISQALQFSGEPLTHGTAIFNGNLQVRAFCIGNQRYSYVTNVRVDPDAPEGQYNPAAHRLRHALWRDTKPSGASACVPLNLSMADPSSGLPDSNGRELLGHNMRLGNNFSVTCHSETRVCNIQLLIIYGDDDLLTPNANNPTGCGNVIGSQWCAASSIKAQVSRRLQQAGQ